MAATQRHLPAPSGSVDKALCVLEALAAQGGSATLATLTRHSGLSKPTAHRVLAVLLAHHMVARSGTDYVLGERLVELAAQVASPDTTGLRHTAIPYLVDLYQATHATIYLGVLCGSDVHYLAKIYGLRPARTPSLHRDSAPAQRTAVGKLLLAYHSAIPHQALGKDPLPALTPTTITSTSALQAELATIRQTGIAHNHGEYTPGVACIAALVVQKNHQPIAGLAVADDITRLNPTVITEHLRRTAFALSLHLRTTHIRPSNAPPATNPSY